MTEECAAEALEMLIELGFTNMQEEHPWNMLQVELEVNGTTICAWGRHWSGIKVQLYQEHMIELCESENIALVKSVCKKAIAFLRGLPVAEEKGQ